MTLTNSSSSFLSSQEEEDLALAQALSASEAEYQQQLVCGPWEMSPVLVEGERLGPAPPSLDGTAVWSSLCFLPVTPAHTEP